MSKVKKEAQTKQENIGYTLLIFVIFLYCVIALFDTISMIEALNHSYNVLKLILPILLVVILLIAVFNTYIHPKMLVKHMGKDSGIKGWAIAVIAGIFSHGPGYVWYPFMQEMRTHGMKEGLIVVFFYARSIKIPWIPMMVSYFSLTFTIILTLYIIISAIIQGIIAEKFLHKNSHKEDQL